MLKSTGAAVAATMLAGCSSGGDGDDGGDSESEETTAGDDGGDDSGSSGENTVAVSPDGDLNFKPEELTVSVGDTVTWDFQAPSHNVSAWPDMQDKISIPDGAEGFGTMEKGGEAFATVDEGTTFEHTFETAGEYTYVCTPHAASGMVGTIVVEE
ncbi:plastocyanin/azurin family copper-binding protein [Halobacterium jilantaiense]|uniref:Plastocyanin n=1 Tax=Halobacterium jilantaiense TaxID=355548 RepID=A0A1I0N713_9EURY|nr:Plastocyanin [Halobacterium jilantaiense]